MIIWNSKSILDGIKNYGTAFARKMGMAGAEGAFMRINKFGHLGGVGKLTLGHLKLQDLLINVIGKIEMQIVRPDSTCLFR